MSATTTNTPIVVYSSDSETEEWEVKEEGRIKRLPSRMARDLGSDFDSDDESGCASWSYCPTTPTYSPTGPSDSPTRSPYYPATPAYSPTSPPYSPPSYCAKPAPRSVPKNKKKASKSRTATQNHWNRYILCKPLYEKWATNKELAPYFKRMLRDAWGKDYDGKRTTFKGKMLSPRAWGKYLDFVERMAGRTECAGVCTDAEQWHRFRKAYA